MLSEQQDDLFPEAIWVFWRSDKYFVQSGFELLLA